MLRYFGLMSGGHVCVRGGAVAINHRGEVNWSTIPHRRIQILRYKTGTDPHKRIKTGTESDKLPQQEENTKEIPTKDLHGTITVYHRHKVCHRITRMPFDYNAMRIPGQPKSSIHV